MLKTNHIGKKKKDVKKILQILNHCLSKTEGCQHITICLFSYTLSWTTYKVSHI